MRNGAGGGAMSREQNPGLGAVGSSGGIDEYI